MSRAANTPSNVHRTFSVRLYRFSLLRRGAPCGVEEFNFFLQIVCGDEKNVVNLHPLSEKALVQK